MGDSRHFNGLFRGVVTENGTHQRFIGIFQVVVRHYIMTDFDIHIIGFAGDMGSNIDVGKIIGQFDDFDEIIEGTVTAAVVQILNVGRAVRPGIAGIFGVDFNGFFGISAVKGEFGRNGFKVFFHHFCGEENGVAFHFGAVLGQDFPGRGIAENNADFG